MRGTSTVAGNGQRATLRATGRALLSLVLIGLPETRTRLISRRIARSIWSRIHARLSLGDALLQDTGEYLGYRVRRVGVERDVFSSDAVTVLHEASAGRLVSRSSVRSSEEDRSPARLVIRLRAQRVPSLRGTRYR